MTELAFNIHGEPFDAPPTMAAWRVRKLKGKGGGAPGFITELMK